MADRDYDGMLKAAERLCAFRGSPGVDLFVDREEANSSFRIFRRRFISELMCEDFPKERLAESVMKDLYALEHECPQGEEAFAYVREELNVHIERALRMSPLRRFLNRWAIHLIFWPILILVFAVPIILNGGHW